MELNPHSVLPDIPGEGERRRFNPIPPGTTLDEAWPELKRRLESLFVDPKLDSTGCMANCGYLHTACEMWSRGAQSEILCKLLINSKIMELFGQCWQNCLTDDLLLRRTDTYHALLELNAAMCILCDNSDPICYRFLQTKVFRVLFTGLSSGPLNPAQMNDPMRSAIAIGHVTILHNVLKRIDGAKRVYREVKNAVAILQKFRNCANLALAMLANIVQSYIINEVENEQVNSTDGSMNPLVQALAESISGQLVNRLKINLPPIEIVTVINNLANTNDNNAHRLMQTGALPHYIEILKPEFGVKCQSESAKGLWTYAFNCPNEILKANGCLQTLENLSSNEDASIRRNASGALWVLNNPVMTQENKAKSARSSVSDNEVFQQHGNAPIGMDRRFSRQMTDTGPVVDERDQHIFISYQWDNKKEAVYIADRVRNEGMNIWIDAVNMWGSVMEAMATAVEKASVIIVLSSQKYKDSMNCRSEAQYAFRLKKRIVPVRVERGYNPDGWLGLLVGSQLIIDLTAQDRIEQEMIKLLREIRPDPSRAVNDTRIVRQPSGISEDLLRWLELNGLSHLSDWFEGMGEPVIRELATLRKEAPAEFFKCLRDEKIPFTDRLKISMALKKSFQL